MGAGVRGSRTHLALVYKATRGFEDRINIFITLILIIVYKIEIFEKWQLGGNLFHLH